MFDHTNRLTLYQYSRKPLDEQVAMYRMLEAEIVADELARQPTLVKKYHLKSMYHVMSGRTRRHGRDVSKLVDRSTVAAPTELHQHRDADIGTRFHAETLAALAKEGISS